MLLTAQGIHYPLDKLNPFKQVKATTPLEQVAIVALVNGLLQGEHPTLVAEIVVA